MSKMFDDVKEKPLDELTKDELLEILEEYQFHEEWMGKAMKSLKERIGRMIVIFSAFVILGPTLHYFQKSIIDFLQLDSYFVLWMFFVAVFAIFGWSYHHNIMTDLCWRYYEE
jgi:hypothetical protein